MEYSSLISLVLGLASFFCGCDVAAAELLTQIMTGDDTSLTLKFTEELIVKSHEGSWYQKMSSPSLVIHVDSDLYGKDYDGFIVNFITFDLPYTDHWLEIITDSGQVAVNLTGPDRLWNSNSNNSTYIFEVPKYIEILWRSKAYSEQHSHEDNVYAKGFELLVTPFTRETSCVHEFRCEEKGLCINYSFACNVRNNCGDPSDEHGCNTVLITALCVFGGLIVIAIISVAFQVRRERNRRRQKQEPFHPQPENAQENQWPSSEQPKEFSEVIYIPPKQQASI